MEHHDQEQVKKPYERPEIKRFPLRPEEAVLGFCKTTGVVQPGGSSCRTGIGNCHGIGS